VWLQVIFIGCRRKAGQQRSDFDQGEVIKKFLTEKYSELGRIRLAELEVLIIFIAIIGLWIMRDPGYTRGWAALFAPSVVTESAPSILAAILLFILPRELSGLCSSDDASWEPILDWKTLQHKMPWGLFLFIGGGICIGDGAQVSGLTAWIGDQMSVFQQLPPVAILFITCAICIFLTELMSNLATASITLPILASICEDLRIHPLYLMLPSVIGCTYAFMLPVATINNALVHEKSGMRTIDMVKAGLPMNLFSVVLLPALFLSWGAYIFNLNEYPAWAERPDR
jgi:sodium-dependent dicarboxylate transporter 2/3/5